MFAKVFSQIFTSSIAENYLVRLVFEDLLVLADVNGIVDMTPEAIARVTNVPIDIVLAGLSALEKPDNRSRTATEDGRRIILLDEHRDWGWRIVNYDKYREIRNDQDRRSYMREYMRKRRSIPPVNKCKQQLAKLAEVEVEVEALTSLSPLAPKKQKGTRIPSDFTVTEEHRTWAWAKKLSNPDDHIDAFIDYWTAKPGAGGVKLDWDATFRNWIRNSKPAGSNGNHGKQKWDGEKFVEARQ